MNMKNLNKTDIGLIGLAVMGENLALNMADKGWNVSVYNRTVPGVEEGVVEEVEEVIAWSLKAGAGHTVWRAVGTLLRRYNSINSAKSDSLSN